MTKIIDLNKYKQRKQQIERISKNMNQLKALSDALNQAYKNSDNDVLNSITKPTKGGKND